MTIIVCCFGRFGTFSMREAIDWYTAVAFVDKEFDVRHSLDIRRIPVFFLTCQTMLEDYGFVSLQAIFFVGNLLITIFNKACFGFYNFTISYFEKLGACDQSLFWIQNSTQKPRYLHNHYFTFWNWWIFPSEVQSICTNKPEVWSSDAVARTTSKTRQKGL